VLSLFRSTPAERPETIASSVRFIETVARDGDGFRMGPNCPKTLLASCFGVLGLEFFGALETLSTERRAELARAIAERQDDSSGLFRDGLHSDDVLFGLKKFTPLYVEWQETYFALHALDALGEKPRHALHFFEPFLERRAREAWLRTLDFGDFWFVSNYLMFLLFFLIVREGPSSPGAHDVLDWLDGRQDSETGFWGAEQGASLFNGMAGAYHVYGFYRYLGRPIHHEDAALAATLSLQQPSGLFGEPGGGACEDVDAIDILVKLRPGSRARDDAVKAALEKALGPLRACRNPDGGYRWTSPAPGAVARELSYSGLSTLKIHTDQSDVWSTWFRPLAIVLAKQRLGQEPGFGVRYRRLPLLGWHV
jgi:hypothetical protein